MMQLLCQDEDEGLWHLKPLSKTCSMTNDFPKQGFLEFNEPFQHAVVGAFNPTLTIMSASDIRYAAVGHNRLSASKGSDSINGCMIRNRTTNKV